MMVRTLVKDANVIIMDEPTSAQDSRSIEYLIKTLNRIKHDRIVILVTHSDELSSIADEIIEIPC